MRRKPLTAAVTRGLMELVILCEAGGPDDVLGELPATPELRRRWADVERACKWVRSEHERREEG